MKKIIINENQFDTLKALLSKTTGKYSYSPEKVLIVKKFLDDNFVREAFPNGIGTNGLPCNIPVVRVIDKTTKQKGIPMFDEQLLGLLDNEWQNMFTDAEERIAFLKQVMKDWYYNKIDNNGSLSVNHI